MATRKAVLLLRLRQLALLLALLALLQPAAARAQPAGDEYDVDKSSKTLKAGAAAAAGTASPEAPGARPGGLRGAGAFDVAGWGQYLPGSSAAGEENLSFAPAASRSFAMIIVSELGDETFIIAAIMAMRHPRQVVLAGALGALYFMTVISAAMGFVMPKLISPELTHNIATVMYFFFGCRLAWIGYHAHSGELEEEMEEAEKNLKIGDRPRAAWQRLVARICTPIFIEAFVLTFLAEWGDRSQIATITLAAHNDVLGVIAGGCVGHSICTAIAVFGGRLIASKISQRTVAFAGSATFFIFALLNLR
jgi:putative Ca2+/H+ antiporter (TMEM165/GDT1 family)